MDEDNVVTHALTLRDVCALLQTTEAIILGLIAREEMRAYVVGGEWRVDAEDLRTYRDHAKQTARTHRMPPARVVAIASMKGGVGRTTTTFALGHALAVQGAQVLLIDGDPQASLTIVAGFRPAPGRGIGAGVDGAADHGGVCRRHGTHRRRVVRQA